MNTKNLDQPCLKQHHLSNYFLSIFSASRASCGWSIKPNGSTMSLLQLLIQSHHHRGGQLPSGQPQQCVGLAVGSCLESNASGWHHVEHEERVGLHTCQSTSHDRSLHQSSPERSLPSRSGALAASKPTTATASSTTLEQWRRPTGKSQFLAAGRSLRQL